MTGDSIFESLAGVYRHAEAFSDQADNAAFAETTQQAYYNEWSALYDSTVRPPHSEAWDAAAQLLLRYGKPLVYPEGSRVCAHLLSTGLLALDDVRHFGTDTLAPVVQVSVPERYISEALPWGLRRSIRIAQNSKTGEGRRTAAAGRALQSLKMKPEYLIRTGVASTRKALIEGFSSKYREAAGTRSSKEWTHPQLVHTARDRLSRNPDVLCWLSDKQLWNPGGTGTLNHPSVVTRQLPRFDRANPDEKLAEALTGMQSDADILKGLGEILLKALAKDEPLAGTPFFKKVND